ncbi:unnamed protein product [Ranitomeya imitator]|uniref:Inter-alpha-trypsin inhibitor heavy chain C-terminal domain-containing protein n=1 Tax=Ranitomeya imitator TaxID=111125 RepID=A0ABN9LSY6_9NEOB|nr:unnamed protein product [Ranitomeya imitator]
MSGITTVETQPIQTSVFLPFNSGHSPIALHRLRFNLRRSASLHSSCILCQRQPAGKQSGDVTALLSGRCAHSQCRKAERRGQTAVVDSDPHFVINVPQKNDALCFNIQEEPGVILSLIKDQELGVSVNGELIGKEMRGNNVLSNGTFFGRFGIINSDMKIKIEVTTAKITVMHHKNKKMFTWHKSKVYKQGRV